MMGGFVLCLVQLLMYSVTLVVPAAAFLSLGAYSTVDRGDDTYSNPINAATPIRLASIYITERTVYVSTNGYFSLGARPLSSSLRRFSASSSYYSVVAPFAADMSTTQAGSVRYNTFTTGDTNINTVSSYIKSKLGGSFSGTWMIVADWYNVPQYDWYTSTTNRFQGAIITDGSSTYAVFIYYCPSMEWSGNAVIGWQASSSYYRNHPLSGTSNARQVACLNTASNYSGILFKLSSVTLCTDSSYFGCFDGKCSYSSSRCDGDFDCPDGSDEVACSFGTCGPNEFQCDYGDCYPDTAQCDYFNDCVDSSDEEDCSPSIDVGLVVGLSAGIFFFLFFCVPFIVVCCVYCMVEESKRDRTSVRVANINSGAERLTITRPTQAARRSFNAPSATHTLLPGMTSDHEPQHLELIFPSQELPPPYSGTPTSTWN